MAGRIRAELSPRPLAGTAVQVPPPSVEYCQAPSVAALAALPTMAMPPSGVALELPVVAGVTWSVASE